MKNYIQPHDLHIISNRTSDFTVHMDNLMCKGCKPKPLIVDGVQLYAYHRLLDTSANVPHRTITEK